MIAGLSQEKVLLLQKEFGENSLPVKEGKSLLFLFLLQFKSPLIYLLLIVGLISFFLGEYFDVGLIYTVVFINVLMSFFQEYNAQKTLFALRKILKPEIIVLREGERKKIETKYLVPGDLVVLGSGDRVPADGKLIEGTNLLVNEAILTGEEEAVEKTAGEKQNKLFMGTTVIFGQAIMEVTAIGKKTEIGKIGLSLEEIQEEETPLQKKLELFSRSLVKLILAICLGIFLLGIFYQHDFWEMAKISTILSVAAIPEGLPVAITVILVLGMRRILRRDGLVKKLLSIETLGSTSVICTDKTGTLTEGKMKVVEADFEDKTKGLLALMLTNNQRTNIEIAFWDHVNSQKYFFPKGLLEKIIKVEDEPFDSEKKYAQTISSVEGKKTCFMVGGAEIILSYCKLSADEKEKIMITIENWADRGLKVVGLSYKELGNLKEKKDFNWLGLLGVEDPVREGVKEAIEIAQKAGIKIKIVTGDFQKTAQRVAANLGMEIKENQIIDGETLEKISGEDLKSRIDNLLLFSRVTPHQKLKIIKILQEKGEIVAMTGDGVNDAPALKKADIGVALGSGSEVAKEAGDLILLDNNFKTIVAAIEEGRLIFANIKKVVAYVLSNAFAIIVLILGTLLLNLPAPLTVVQILWIHLICDGPPDILLSFEGKENNLMEQSPKYLGRAEILSRFVKLIVVVVSFSAGLFVLGLFISFYKLTNNLTLARTVAFATLSTISLIYIFSFKNLHKLIIKTENFFENKLLFLGVIYGFILILAAVYLPFLNKVLGTAPLHLFEWALVLGASFLITLMIETAKIILPNY